jgi:hypothetical protein
MVNIGDFRDTNLSFYNNSAGHAEAQGKDALITYTIVSVSWPL